MKSHGILSRYVRPGFKEGCTYDDKRRAESENKWKAEHDAVMNSAKSSIYQHNRLLDTA